jgi:parvulin-like peptidyl-prolyl isomerase
MRFLGRLLREPLVHFTAAGAVLFTVFILVRGPDAGTDDPTRIVIDRATLTTYMQYRANAFEPEAFDAILESMTDEEIDRLVDAYVDDEVLYREAKSLGLEASDYVIRQRMIQKMRFLVGDIAEAQATIDEDALEDYYRANEPTYHVEPSVTFTHVFFDADRRGADGAEAAARAALTELNAEHAGFNDAPGRGDRFPFLKNYVERTYEYVGNHFGAEFADALAGLDASDQWRGPIRSAYGWHVVLVTSRDEGRTPALDEVRDQVERDYRRDQGEEKVEEMTAALRDRYQVELVDIPKVAPPGAEPEAEGEHDAAALDARVTVAAQ